jgi:hypothetical protein
MNVGGHLPNRKFIPNSISMSFFFLEDTVCAAAVSVESRLDQSCGSIVQTSLVTVSKVDPVTPGKPACRGEKRVPPLTAR